MRKISLFFIISLLFTFVSCSKQTGESDYVPAVTSIVDKQFNFHIVTPGVWRSSQPNRESLDRMKKHGLKTVINLRGDKATNLWERHIADSLGLKYYNIQIDARYEQNTDTVRYILSIMHDSAHQPVLIHCLGGKDRTGMLSAIYKMRYCGTSFEDAYREMLMYGYHENDYPHLVETITETGNHSAN
ncbi:tyrosine-protein phosphatase [bacterium]|nr:tyrosine-protein phosphatase [bacterium]